MMRAAVSLLVALALTGCRTPEPAAEERAAGAEPAIAEAPSPSQVEGDEKPGKDDGAAKTSSDPKLPSEPPAEAAPTEGKTPAEPTPVEPTPVGPTANVPADVEPPGDDGPEQVPPAAEPAIPDGIQTYFAGDLESDDPRFTARKPPKRAEELEGLLDVRPLLGQTVLASPKDAAEVLATVAVEGLVTPTESCPWVSFDQELAWTKGKIRCGDLFLRQPDTGEGMVEMVPVLETVTTKGTRWSRIIATQGGRTGWVKTEIAPRRFTKVLAEYSAGGSRTWDRTLYAEPGGTPTKLAFRGAIALRIRETKKVDGRTWLRVEARVDQCIEGSRRKLGEGWMPQHAEGGSLNVYYELSC
jgi:hypothetical protein